MCQRCLQLPSEMRLVEEIVDSEFKVDIDEDMLGDAAEASYEGLTKIKENMVNAVCMLH